MTALVRARQVVRRCGRTTALDGIDRDIAQGESVALVGHEGAGRTTLLQILAALRPPTSGTVEIAGIDAARFPFEARLKALYVGAGLPAVERLTVREYLEFVGRSPRGRAAGWTNATSDIMIDRSGLAADAMVDALSTIMRKRLALAVAIAAAPRVLLLDDPFASLDTDGRSCALGWLMEAHAAGTTIVAAVNDASDVTALCDPILRMQQGLIVSRETSRAFGRPRLAGFGEAGVA